MNEFKLICGDALEVLKTLPNESVNCCITSPAYFGLRDYGVIGQMGLEDTPKQYIENLVNVFREVRRVLWNNGTLWVNIGDSYAANRTYQVTPTKWKNLDFGKSNASKVPEGLKPKDLIGIPWMLAFALRDDGWYLRSEIIWHKPNVMPESVKDRPTKAHEQIFLLSKMSKYYYDADSIREPHNEKYIQNRSADSYGENTKSSKNERNDRKHSFVKRYSGKVVGNPLGRNKRSIWTIKTVPFTGAHFATFPPELPRMCMLAGCPEGGTVLDPFAGASTTGIVAVQNNRNFIGIELNPKYVELSNQRYEESKKPSLTELFED